MPLVTLQTQCQLVRKERNKMRTPNNYRQTLEAEKESLLSMLPHVRQDEKARGVRRVREIIDILNQMDQGADWSQEPGDTQAEIVLSEVRSSVKVFRA